MDQDYYELWHLRFDDEDRDYDKFLGIFSTPKEAEQGLARLRDQLGFRDYPHGFEITWGRVDETCETEGFVTVPGDEVPGAGSRS